jgi:ABC-2 type transport system permease protein
VAELNRLPSISDSPPFLRGTNQFAAILRARLQTFVHSLRSSRGVVNLLSRAIVGIMVALGGIGGAIGLGAAAWMFVTDHNTGWLAALLWFIFVFWQMFPVLGTAFSQNIDTSDLLRFPLSYRSYFLVRLVYGVVDIATALCSLWLLGIVVGVGVADFLLLPWTALVILMFAMVNVLLSRTIFSWVERWLARRRTRELLGVLFFLLIISFQLVGPLLGRYGHKPTSEEARIAGELSPLQRISPPGLAGAAIARFERGNTATALGFLMALIAYSFMFLVLLDRRMRAQYHGESLSEGAEKLAPGTAAPPRVGWILPGVPGPITATIEKEMRYLSRSGPMLLTLIMPAFMLLIFRLGPSGHNEGMLSRAPALAFPVGAAYALLMLTNLVYNNFGADSSGVQLYFALPVRLRSVIMAKNLSHLAILALEVLVIWLAVGFMYQRPPLAVTIATIAAMLFAAPINLAAGNLLSIHWPKRVEFGVFGRQRAAPATILVSFGIQFLVFGLVALVIWYAQSRGNMWLAAGILLLLAALSLAAYFLILGSLDRVAMDHREVLISELSRA